MKTILRDILSVFKDLSSEDSRYLKLYKLNNLTPAVCVLLTKHHHMNVCTQSITDTRTYK